MLIIACLIWVGITLNAPVWFYILLGLRAMYQLVYFGVTFGKALNDKENK